jgi:hypothetical protein
MTRRDAGGRPLRARARCLAIFRAVSLALPLASALADTPFDSLLGSWAGSGQVRYQDGRSDSVRCTAYYTEGGQRLKLAIRCRSSGTEIEIRGQLIAREGVVSGTWEERTFNANGKASGRVSRNQLTLSVTGGGFSGSMSVAYGAARQFVTISTHGIAMRGVTVTMSRGG